MIFLDHNATTPVLPEVAEAMLPWLTTNWGNPSSIYGTGRVARKAVEEARDQVAALVGALPEQVIFTSGATEANNAALHSAVFRDRAKRHLVTSSVEHSAVLTYCNYLEKVHGIEVTRLPVDSKGKLNPDQLRSAIREDTALVSLMWANNETGVIWPISEFASICKDMAVPMHTDAVQAVGKISVSFSEAGVDYLSLSGHKFGAPKGIGVLVIRDRNSYLPLIYGGKQELGSRGGTENVANIFGMGKAADIVTKYRAEDWGQIIKIRNRFESEITDRIKGSRINGRGSRRLPNTSNVNLPSLDGESAVTYLDQQGICVSSGSACLENTITPSHVLMAMTGSYEISDESIRVSLGLETTADDLERLIVALEAFTIT